MKKQISALILLLAFALPSQAQRVPSVKVKTLEGRSVDIADLANDPAHPVVLSFWATWCQPCIKELDNISEDYAAWQSETGVRLIAVCTDDSRSVARVPSLVASKGWDFEVVLDTNQELQRAMGINSIPHSYALKAGSVTYSHSGYADGDELELYNHIVQGLQMEQDKK